MDTRHNDRQFTALYEVSQQFSMNKISKNYKLDKSQRQLIFFNYNFRLVLGYSTSFAAEICFRSA